MKKNRKIIVVGATGYVGKAVLEAARQNGIAVGTSTRGMNGLISFQLNVANNFDYQIIEPGDTVILCAAISAPDVCAKNYDFAKLINVDGTALFVGNVIDRGARVIFLSSDTVYGERDGEFDESAVCNPVGEYAEMKHAIEIMFKDNESFKSVRLSYVFSLEDKLTQYLIRCADEKLPVDVFHPFSRAIIYRGDVVKGLMALIQKWDLISERFLNFGGPMILSRIDFVNYFRDVHAPNLVVNVVEPNEDFFKNRPRIIAMKSSILDELLNGSALRIDDAMKVELSKLSCKGERNV